MRLSLRIRYAGPGQLAELTVAAERLGYDGVWVSEPWGVDAGSVLGWCAAATRRLQLGTHVASVFARTPAAPAALAASVQSLSGGRFRLGLGTSGRHVVESWHGVAFAHPVRATGETIGVVRAVLRGEPLRLAGDGPPLRSAYRGEPVDVPIYVGALGPRNQRMTADLADGWTPTPYSPDHHDAFAAPLTARLAANGRSVAIAPVCPMAAGSDVGALLRLEKRWSALYLGGMGPFYAAAATAMGHAETAAAVRKHWAAGDRRAAADAVTDAYAAAIGLFGSAVRIREWVQRYRGVDELVVELRKPDLADQIADLRAVREAIG